MFKLFFFTLRRNQIKVQMKRVLFTLIGLILLSLGTAETASAQRTATGKAFIGVNQFVSGYAIPSEEGNAAVRLLASEEGIFLDPVYTGKAFAGLVAMAKEGAFRPDEKVLFLHSGGAGGLFAVL